MLVNGMRYVETVPLLFEECDGGNRVFFFSDEAGRLHFTSGLWAYRRIAWQESRRFHVSVLLTSMLVMATSLPWLFRRAARGASRVPGGRARKLLAAACLLLMLFIVSFHLAMRSVRIETGVPLMMKALFILPVMAVCLAAIPLLYAVRLLPDSRCGSRTRIHYAVVLAFVLVFIGFLSHWNLLGFRF